MPRLDPILRVYVACATDLYGDVSSTDLVKIHIQSGKVTLMRFDDFAGSAVPRMVERVKVKLREQDMEVFEYGGQFPSPLLYFKSRYINEEFPHYPEQLEFDQQIEGLGIVESDSYGPAKSEFLKRMRGARREVSGMRLCPASDIPPLDEACGHTFTYRELIECGESWKRTRCDNTPRRPESYNALYALATEILDPVVEYFGAIKLTYGFASSTLTRNITKAIAPKLDQHVSCEVGESSNLFCPRAGAAVDFLIEYEDMREVARWIAENCLFDRMYFYGAERPLHVSTGPQHSGEMYELIDHRGKAMPRRLKFS